MKRTLAAFVAGLTFGATGIGVAATTGIIKVVTNSGATCYFGTGPQGRGVLCNRSDKKGYMATVTQTKVLVWKQNGAIVFFRRQP
ncbi:MAG: hypothetical protein QOF45_2411 [Gaiellaceae bacterium]|nr:hypothetical protein [Gaiellaceae bacterium]